ncbi:MAG: HAD-IIB family hydrolase [Myxococcota bacterium]
MQPLAHFPDISGLRAVLMDIDDTLTLDGKLVPEAFVGLARMREAGLIVIPVTGRPAGWCDLIARQWPVNAVVGENGAFAFLEDEGCLQMVVHPDAAGDERRERLTRLSEAILREVPGARVAKDQHYRRFDVAIDFREEPPDLGIEAAEAIRKMFVDAGASAKISSIHVNGWFGAYDKLSMVRQLLASHFSIDVDAERENVVFVGDSPNDAPMFAHFPNAVGVANVRDFGDRVRPKPAFVTERRGGYGFAELVARILER